MTTVELHTDVTHDGCWFCYTPVCDECPDTAPRFEVLHRDAWVPACDDCAADPQDHGATLPCADCGAQANRPCADTCPSWQERERESLEAAEAEVAHERQWGGAA